MKRFFICAAAAIVALAACSKTEVINNSVPQEIGFKAVTGAMTKAPLSGTTLPTDGENNMVVYASSSETAEGEYASYFDGVEFGWNSTSSDWTGTTPQYWPESGFLKFKAFYPASVGTASGTATTDVTITGIDISSTQTDILYANLTGAQSAETKPVVPLVFNHALSQIVVKAAVTAEGMTDVNITSVEIVTPHLKGNLKLTGTDATWTSEANASNLVMENNISSTDLTITALELGTGALVIPSAQTSLKITYSVKGFSKEETKELTGNWVKGNKYIYNLKVGLDEIHLSATVEKWVDTPAGGTNVVI